MMIKGIDTNKFYGVVKYDNETGKMITDYGLNEGDVVLEAVKGKPLQHSYTVNGVTYFYYGRKNSNWHYEVTTTDFQVD